MLRVMQVRDFCLGVLASGELEAKLAPPAQPLDDSCPGPAQYVELPARSAEIAFAPRSAPLPRPAQVRDGDAIARCLARFAHHELMAVELFAWALLRWPELPASLRRGFLGALLDEQRHARLYLERLRAHGSQLADHPASGYFWLQVPRIHESPHGARAFLATLGLTFEQANLDFAPLYRDAFRQAGDPESAAVCQVVHDDEVRHVKLAAHWLARLAGGARQLDAYREAVPFPLGPRRAKGRVFDAEARRRAGLEEDFIDWVREARRPPG